MFNTPYALLHADKTGSVCLATIENRAPQIWGRCLWRPRCLGRGGVGGGVATTWTTKGYAKHKWVGQEMKWNNDGHISCQ